MFVDNGRHCEVEQITCHQLWWQKGGLSYKFAFTQDTKLVSKMQKKNKHANLMSTSHNAAEVSAQEDRKAAIILSTKEEGITLTN